MKNAADAPARTVATATAETQADDDALEEARRDVARLREANEDLLARQQHAAAAAAAAASPRRSTPRCRATTRHGPRSSRRASWL